MKNPNPIARARRIEMRRKQLGYPSRCFYCPETDLFCFEEDHPVTRELDEKFKRVVCRNCHRKMEADRDIKGLTKNGQRDVFESADEKQRRLAYDGRRRGIAGGSARARTRHSCQPHYRSISGESDFASTQGPSVIIVQPARCEQRSD